MGNSNICLSLEFIRSHGLFGPSTYDVHFSFMGCVKKINCELIDGEYFIPEDKKKYDKDYYDKYDAIEVVPINDDI